MNPKSPRFRAARRMGAAAAGLLAGAGLAAAAHAGGYNPASLPEGQLAQVNQVCSSIIRVRPGEEHFGNCVESLSASLSDLNQSRGLERARAECLSKGLVADSPQMSRCIVETQAADPAVQPISDPAGAGPGEAAQLGGQKSYFEVSPAIAYRREQLACASLGIDPAARAFANCVSGLKMSLLAANTPMN
jgi:hypothetical protein